MSSKTIVFRCLALVAVGALWSACFVPDPTPSDGTDVEVPSNVQLSDSVHFMPYGKPHFLAAGGTPHLTYYGGPVISNVKVVMLNWGSGVNGESTLESFYPSVTNSAYFDWLSEYNTSTPVDRPRHLRWRGHRSRRPRRARPSRTPRSSPRSARASMTAPCRPTTPTPSTWCTFRPASRSPRAARRRASSSAPITAPSPATAERLLRRHPRHGWQLRVGLRRRPRRSRTPRSVSSHEMIEAVTDAAVGLAQSYGPPLAWYDQTNGEIGDICNGQQGTINGFYVQKEWSNSQNACIVTNGGSTPPPPPPPPPPSGTTTLDNGVAVTGLSGAKGSNTMFKIDVPSGATNLKFAISGGTGDADIYVKFGAEPTTSSYDYRPYLTGNNETVNDRVAAGRHLLRHDQRLRRLLGRPDRGQLRHRLDRRRRRRHRRRRRATTPDQRRAGDRAVGRPGRRRSSTPSTCRRGRRT